MKKGTKRCLVPRGRVALTLRAPKLLRDKLELVSYVKGKSLNQYVCELLDKSVPDCDVPDQEPYVAS